LVCSNAMFRVTGSVVVFPGFLAVYADKEEEGSKRALPAFEEGEKTNYKDISCLQHFTEPPPRYSEASLVKTLEEHGIGRPSTYVSIISTLINRGYVELNKRRFHLTDIGGYVNKFLTKYFGSYVDYGFTAGLEDNLDAVSRGEKKWKPLLKAFWKPFFDQVGHVGKTVTKKDVTHEQIDEKCPKCQSILCIKLGKAGRFIGCTAYPDCGYTSGIDGEGKPEAPSAEDEAEKQDCPKCKEGKLALKQGRFGKFFGCSLYPACKHTEPLNKPIETEVVCPSCQKGNIVQKFSKRGAFFACSAYPDCRYALSSEPVAKKCKQCKWPVLIKKQNKTKGEFFACPQKDCAYEESNVEA